MSGSKIINVVAAIIIKKDEILLCQRSEKAMHALKWEFPGGKIVSGETPEEALSRELEEELKLEVTGEEFLIKKTHYYKAENLTVKLHFYDTQVSDHKFENLIFKKVLFVPVSDLENYDLLDADKNALPELMAGIKKYYL